MEKFILSKTNGYKYERKINRIKNTVRMSYISIRLPEKEREWNKIICEEKIAKLFQN